MPAGPKELAQRRAFGQRVRTLRQAKGLSQEALAHAAKLDRTYVGGIERGERNPSLDNIHRIASALRVSAADLLVDSNAPASLAYPLHAT